MAHGFADNVGPNVGIVGKVVVAGGASPNMMRAAWAAFAHGSQSSSIAAGTELNEDATNVLLVVADVAVARATVDAEVVAEELAAGAVGVQDGGPNAVGGVEAVGKEGDDVGAAGMVVAAGADEMDDEG